MALTALTGIVATTEPAAAQTATARPAPDAPLEKARFRVRLNLSNAAAKRLGELRVRRLLRLEVDDLADLDERTAGTLEGDDLIRVWIDVPTQHRAVVEVRRVDGSFARRALAIGGFPSDVAAEVVSLAAEEMVRIQARASRTPAPQPQPQTTREPSARGAFAAGAAVAGLVLPASEPVFFLGPELALELRHGAYGHRLYGRWQVGVADRSARWLEVGAGIDFRWHLAASWRVHLGVKGGFVDVALPTAALIEDEATTHAWTVRMAGEIGLEGRVAPGTWLTLSVEPGAALRPLDVQYADGTATEMGGFALGLNLGLTASPFEDD